MFVASPLHSVSSLECSSTSPMGTRQTVCPTWRNPFPFLCFLQVVVFSRVLVVDVCYGRWKEEIIVKRNCDLVVLTLGHFSTQVINVRVWLPFPTCTFRVGIAPLKHPRAKVAIPHIHEQRCMQKRSRCMLWLSSRGRYRSCMALSLSHFVGKCW